MDTGIDEEGAGADRRLVAATVGDCAIYVAAHTNTASGLGAEQEIGARLPRIEGALDGLVEFAGQIVRRFEQTDAQKVTVEFGCDVVLESGTFLAVIGKASSTSSLTVGLEWVRPAGK